MIVTKMIGGLGNQMFQYAAGLALSVKNSTQLFIDNTGSLSDKTHSYSLSVFNIKAEVFKGNTALNAGTQELMENRKLSYYRLKKFNYDNAFEMIKDDTYIEGFFQSEKFFHGVEDRLRTDFTLKEPAKDKNIEMMNKIRSCESVSLHIRRGDYFDNWKNRLFHGVNLMPYYKKTVNSINKNLKNPVFFVFSDDQEWVKKNFKGIVQYTPVEINDSSQGYEDLRLISTCSHNIVANSTFSWWGAWLNLNPHKLVFAPKRWFNNPFINTSDLVPKTWKRF
ncbi:MAG: alpha-1,2-fucosyltransferase [Candidatus Goldbacteria bacterium]|nr:alpha-1,2-fucosyltransferase [Candidatus Goldiibacteriota bacterium]